MKSLKRLTSYTLINPESMYLMEHYIYDRYSESAEFGYDSGKNILKMIESTFDYKGWLKDEGVKSTPVNHKKFLEYANSIAGDGDDDVVVYTIPNSLKSKLS